MRLLAIAGVTMMGLAGCAAEGPSTEQRRIEGTVQLTGASLDLETERSGASDDSFVEGGFCAGRGGYADLRGGADVVVRDGDNSVIGKNELREGEISMIHPSGEAGVCSWSFSVQVERADFYAIEVARRGGPTFSSEDLRRDDWKVELSFDP